MWLKIGMLGIGIKYKQLDDALSAIGSNNVCHRKAHAFLPDAFFTKDAIRKKISLGCSSSSRSVE
jgi:hypothetical protein